MEKSDELCPQKPAYIRLYVRTEPSFGLFIWARQEYYDQYYFHAISAGIVSLQSVLKHTSRL